MFLDLKISNLKWRFQKLVIYVFRFENICNYKLVATVYSKPTDSHFYLQLKIPVTILKS